MDYPLWDAIVKQASVVELDKLVSPGHRKKLVQLTYQSLFIHREFVIKWVKAPVMKALVTGKTFTQVMKTIVLVAKRIPRIKRENVEGTNDHAFLDIVNVITGYLNSSSREEMVGSGLKMMQFEYAHDRFYKHIGDVMLEEFLLATLTGDWGSRLEGWPAPIFWREKPPYGGKHSIIHALREHREEIIKLLGDEWKCLEGVSYKEFHNLHRPVQPRLKMRNGQLTELEGGKVVAYS